MVWMKVWKKSVDYNKQIQIYMYVLHVPNLCWHVNPLHVFEFENSNKKDYVYLS